MIDRGQRLGTGVNGEVVLRRIMLKAEHIPVEF